MTLTAPERARLRKAVVAHPSWEAYRGDGWNISTMTVAELVDAAGALGVDVPRVTRDPQPELVEAIAARVADMVIARIRAEFTS